MLSRASSSRDVPYLREEFWRVGKAEDIRSHPGLLMSITDGDALDAWYGKLPLPSRAGSNWSMPSARARAGLRMSPGLPIGAPTKASMMGGHAQDSGRRFQELFPGRKIQFSRSHRWCIMSHTVSGDTSRPRVVRTDSGLVKMGGRVFHAAFAGWEPLYRFLRFQPVPSGTLAISVDVYLFAA